MSETIDIEATKAQYPEEWLLFEVLETDELDRPTQGRLLFHGKSREELHQVAMVKRSRERSLLIAFTGDPIPPDMVVVL